MIIVVKPEATKEEMNEIIQFLEINGLKVHLSQGTQRTIIGVVGDKSKISDTNIALMSGVEKIVPIVESYKLVGKVFRPEGTVIDFGNDAKIGGNRIAMIAGPCAIESEEQIFTIAKAVSQSGAQFLRGGAYKPRTSPYSFQGLELEGLKMMKAAAKQYNLKVVSEIVSESDLDKSIEYIDMIQIGARNSQNFRLLKEVGKIMKPVLLKRGIAQTIEELLGSAEYIMSEGNYEIVLCERGIRTFETSTRNTLDISAIPVLKSKTHLPVIVDPSHASGQTSYIPSLSRAAIAAGADGLIVEVHPNPISAVSDALQQLTPDQFSSLCGELDKIATAIGRTFHGQY
ncbi:MAG: 3-deoxy-7-phosphoheptulonate synthase [Saccharofermentanales bacterium]